MKSAVAVVIACVLAFASAQASETVQRERAHTRARGHGSTSSVTVPLAPVLGRALTHAGIPEARALRPCVDGWPMSPIFASGAARRWAADQVQAACVINAAETELAGRLVSKTWSDAGALQRAANQAAQRIDLSRIRRACPLPDSMSVTPVSGDAVQAQIGALALLCDAQGVTIRRDGATLFGGGAIDGRLYSVAIERSANDSTSDRVGVSGAFLSPP